ncbi:MAG: MBL fold metallo-hydrolase [Deltaproteobacteria bacterium]|nr:MBL fold metallo-hydrolase [Deltaproteobacteria bacterium]
MSRFRIRFWGVRGSIPTPGPTTVRIGGNTSCVEVRCGDRLVVLDGGTGLRVLGDELVKEMPIHATMFFSHVHWDHIQGFPFFKPAFVKGNHFDIFGGRNLNATLAETLAGQMNFPNFPVTLEQMAATMVFHQFDDGQIVDLGDGVEVKALRLNHPDGSYGYRIMYGGRALAYCTDTEHLSEPDKHVLELADKADVFVYDAQYTPEEYQGKNGMPKVGWGHSTFEEGARLARLAGAKRLVLFHHDPYEDDETVLAKERRCRELFPQVDAAFEGLSYEL